MNRRIVIPGGSGRVGLALARYFHTETELMLKSRRLLRAV